MSKGYSGWFHGTLGTTYIGDGENSESYSDRGIELPEYIKQALSELKKSGDIIERKKGIFSMKDVSVMSKEEGVEFAHVTIGNKIYLIRGNKGGAVVPREIQEEMARKGGTLDFHSHPFDNDCVPSADDTDMVRDLKRITGQATSLIVTPNGRTVIFGPHGVIETGIVSNIIDQDMKETYIKLFGGK